MILFAFIFIVCVCYIYFHYYFIRKTPPLPQNHVVLMKRKKFNKDTVTIQMNDSISFINKDIVRHQVLNDSNNINNSILLSPNDTFRITLSQPGTYKFYSGLYEDMNSCVVTVENDIISNHVTVEKEISSNVSNLKKKVFDIFEQPTDSSMNFG